MGTSIDQRHQAYHQIFSGSAGRNRARFWPLVSFSIVFQKISKTCLMHRVGYIEISGAERHLPSFPVYNPFRSTAKDFPMITFNCHLSSTDHLWLGEHHVEPASFPDRLGAAALPAVNQRLTLSRGADWFPNICSFIHCVSSRQAGMGHRAKVRTVESFGRGLKPW